MDIANLVDPLVKRWLYRPLLHKKTFLHRPCGAVKTVRCKVVEKHCTRNGIARKYLKCMKYFEDLKTSDGLNCS